MSTTRRVRFRSADGVDLDGRLRLPDGPPRGTALICHPHPGFGGHMDVWLLPSIAEDLARDGWATLRFNFRGVGREGGVSADAAGEVADVAGAWELARARTTPGRRAVVGWSFGALVGLLHATSEAGITDWVGITPPTAPTAGVVLPPVPESVADWAARRTVILGEHDRFSPADRVGVLAPDAVRVLAGADHFLFDRDDEVAALVTRALT